MKTELIVFDFDGTLADTTATILATYMMVIEKIGADKRSDAECQATIGLPLKEGFRQLYPDFSEAQLDNCVETYRIIFDENKQKLVPKLYPEVKETLEAFATMGIEMSIASSRSRDSLIEFCENCGIIQCFSLILGADNVMNPKPDPEPVLITLERLGRVSGNTLVVGDMPVDIAMGNGAGCATIGVTYGNSSRRELMDAGADFVIDRFSELTKYINTDLQ